MRYDGINFGFRDMDGSKVHNKRSMGRKALSQTK